MMKLEFMEEFSGSSDQIIVKGKRAKRRRPSSSASSTGGGGGFYNLPVSSPTTSSTTTEEDEDMAHCLILLARGSSPSKCEQIKTASAATAAAGKVGVYVYECKTCNRAFPSFQALGGHRASHKRPKTADVDDRKKQPPPDSRVDEEGQFRPPLLANPVNRICYNEQSKAKTHECSICGSEFGSGQALGGHMRRHRAAASISTRICTNDTTSSRDVCEKPRSMLALDLNLPAPPEEQFPATQPPHLVFSAAALVDCHH